MLVVKALVDYLKHFFLTRMNRISIMFYSGMRKDIFKKLHSVENRIDGEVFEVYKCEKEVETA